jgi:hypothetical protein
MSTKSTIRLEQNEATREAVHVYEEAFDEEHIYIDFEGFHFEAASSMDLSGEWGPRLTLRLPNEWARKLGLIKKRAEAIEDGQGTAEAK